MNYSRRRFVLAGAISGAGLFAGCLGNVGNEGTGDENDSSTNGTSSKSCDEPAFDLVDEPPHGPERPSTPDDVQDGDDWDDHFLGEGMDTDSAVSFDPIELRLYEPVVDATEFAGQSVFYADLLTSRESFENLAEPIGDDAEDRFEAIDFDEEAVVIVVSGFGSSSVRHEWVRVDDHCEQVHLHGYYGWPYLQTGDYTTRTSGIVVDRSDENEFEQAWVSLTVDETTRVNVPTDGEVHVVDDDGKRGDDDSDSKGHGTVEDVRVEQVPRESHGGWRRADTDETGVVVQLADEDELRAVTRDDEIVDRFVETTAFDRDAVFLVESAGPNACYSTLEVDDVTVDAHDDGDVVRADVRAVDTKAVEACPEVVTYPAALVRVVTEDDVNRGEFSVTDGWETEATVESISVAEFAREDATNG